MDEETQEDVKQVVKGVRGLSGALAVYLAGALLPIAAIMILCLVIGVVLLFSR